MDSRPNPAARDGWVAWTMVAGNEQQQAVAMSDCMLETPIDCAPCGVEGHAVKVEHAIRLNRSAAKAFVPASVQRAFT